MNAKNLPSGLKLDIIKSGRFHIWDDICLEVVSKPQIAFESKAQVDEKAQHTWKYVSILRRLATQPLGVRCIFQIAFKQGFHSCDVSDAQKTLP